VLIENITDLPAGTLGFRASGKVSSDEYRQMMEPIYAAITTAVTCRQRSLTLRA
jgi:hypothetical protein